MSKTMERITFILTWIFQGASYLSAYAMGSCTACTMLYRH
ncbi:fatty acid desaturase [Nonlabens ulvanivorans]|uniref:Fatty acid desaturase n=1 Tax=Nonlabens ulvanivorans TaxID=906888 RepID=A0A090X3A5_NONUL|nr:fatty acid desaturase [Nonlabens ulvanivorans]